jgi:hypothetical protein
MLRQHTFIGIVRIPFLDGKLVSADVEMLLQA